MAEVSVFRCQVLPAVFVFPDTRNLKPHRLRFGARHLIFYGLPPLQYINALVARIA